MRERRSNPVIEYLSEERLPWLIAAGLFALLSMIPFFILGQDSIVTYHDQLDGELITYLLNAKHLFDGSVSYPELMNGISKNGLVSPAPFFVLFFALFKPFTAFMICTVIVRLVSILSMFLFLDELTGRKVIAFLLAGLFMLLPFYTVYGLCIPGQPFLYYAMLRFRKYKWEWPLYFGVAFYVACSSFSLGGYAVACVCGVVLVISLIKREYWVRYLILCAIVGVGYILENLNLVAQIFGKTEGFVSHKSEVVHTAVPFLTGLKENLLYGADYTKAYQLYYIPVIVFAIVFGIIFILNTAGDKEEIEEAYHSLIIGAICILVTALIVSFINGKVFTSFANSGTGLIHDFNFSRFSWLMTVMWMAEFALSLNMLWLMAKGMAWRGFCMVVYVVALIGSIGVTSLFAFMNSDLKSNVVKLSRGGDYYMMTWRQFFAEDLFAEVDSLIGLEKSEYRVVSLGIYPAAACYNGFYCLDAYSNNYSRDYKHQFRKIIAPQLDKSEYLTAWFDNWGNRCYLVLNESMNYFTFEKRWTPYTSEYELDFEVLKEMGCEYIISATYLIDCEKYNLVLLNKDEQPIETDGSWYRLWVYRIK